MSNSENLGTNENEVQPIVPGARSAYVRTQPVNFAALGRRMVGESKRAREEWTAEQVTSELAGYLTRVAALDRDVVSIPGVLRGLALRRELAHACSTRPDTRKSAAAALDVIKVLIEDAEERLAESENIDDPATRDSLEILGHEAWLALDQNC